MLCVSCDLSRISRNFFWSFFVLLLVSGCGGADHPLAEGLDSALEDNQCSIQGQNQFVYQVMQDIYFWNDTLPVVDPNSFDSPESLLEALRFRPLDDTFTTIRDTVSQTQFFAEGQSVAIGVTLVFDDQGGLRVAEAVSGSPADLGGIQRGDEILAINGVVLADVLAGEGIGAAFGPDEVGVTVELSVRNLAGLETDLSLDKQLITIPPVPVVSIFDSAGVQVGYVNFKTFITPAFDELDSTFSAMAAAGVQEVILDLRYNGGGFVAVAEFLGNLIGGANTDGQIFSTRVFNANNTDRNTTTFFADEENALDLTRIFVITGRRTASASELLINALFPYLEVVVIGDRTFGKPVGSLGFSFCDKTLNPTAFTTRNANDQGDYFDGLPVNCSVPDDLTQPLGVPQEAATAAALEFLQTGLCPVSVKSLLSKPRPTATGLRSLHWVY